MTRLALRRGDVLAVRLDPVEGSEQGGTRPVLVISSDALNRQLPVVTVASITTRKVERVFSTEVLVLPPDGSLTRPSKVLLYQLRTVSPDRVLKKIGVVSADTLALVARALHVALDLPADD
ncbi:MAG: type II toxin-antitoxin system PemK/MazF family toxin [Armatimonadetes bacterium]|nr:type II toxin-antitoxin system PemK/MazF family toxin [Armatimonadota bacterium]